MSRRQKILFGLVLVAGGITTGAVVCSLAGKGANDEIRSLRERVDAIESRPLIVVPTSERSPEARGDLPPGSHQREFNGLTYYIMPIGGERPAAAAIRPGPAVVTVPAR